MEGYKILMASYPNVFDSIMFRAVRGVILDILNKINRADFFINRHEVKIPIRAHVKLQKLMLGAESVYMPFSLLI
jgi:hypothetical protein